MMLIKHIITKYVSRKKLLFLRNLKEFYLPCYITVYVLQYSVIQNAQLFHVTGAAFSKLKY